jgi:DtxR family Mn-dependent transcriptional regulator
MTGPIQEDQEMYLKILFEFHLGDPDSPIRTSQVAEAMEVSGASASEMLKRLGSKGFVDHIPYKGVTMTERGIEAASRVKRREGLMEVFLVKMLDYQGDVHDAACKLEHALTDELEHTIDRLLGYPETTSDGTPIPQVKRHITAIFSRVLLPLRSLPEGIAGTIELLVIDGVEARTLSDLGIKPGARITRLQDRFEIDGVEAQLSEALQGRILARTD